MDREVLRDIWQGQLPLCFNLSSDDIVGMHRPEPYYMMVSRITYFPMVLDRVVKYFQRFLDEKDKQTLDNMWIDYNGQPIKWHHPIGVSWDLFGSIYDLPWRLILHFSKFPDKELVRCNTKELIESNFMSSIKEADALKHKGTVIKNMVKKDNNTLWSGLVNDSFDKFWSINKRLMEKTDNELFRYIPFRLYLPDYTYVQKTVRPCTIEKSIFQDVDRPKTDNVSLISSVYEYDTDILIKKSYKCIHSTSSSNDEKVEPSGHRCTTMLDLIQISFSNRMNDLIQCSDIKRNLDSSTSLEENEEGDNNLIDVNSFKYKFLAHGIEIPFETPLQWLSEHFSYPDNFLHICAVIKSTDYR